LLAGAHQFKGNLRDLLHDVPIDWLGGVEFCRVKRVVVDVLELDVNESDESTCMAVVAYARNASVDALSTDSAVVAAMRTRVTAVSGAEAYQTLFGVKIRRGSGRLRERQIGRRVFYEALIVGEKDSARVIEKERGKIMVYLDSLRIVVVRIPDAAVEAGSPEWMVMESLELKQVEAHSPSAPPLP
jgi:hypothetical protein